MQRRILSRRHEQPWLLFWFFVDCSAGNLRYLANSSSSGTGPSSFNFLPSGNNTSTFLATFTGFSGLGFGNGEFGWTTDHGATLHPLFTVVITALGTTARFAPGNTFEYYVKNGFGQIFFTGSDGKQFALFSEEPASPNSSNSLTTYWIAAEDTNGPRVYPRDFCLTPGCGSDYDFNDIIVKIVSPPTNVTLDAPYQVRYASNLVHGDSVVNITNTGVNGAPLFGPGFGAVAGNLCVNVYAFSPDEQLISCCSCAVTPNGLVSLTANRDLVSNTLTGVRPDSIVIKLVATATGVAPRVPAEGAGSLTYGDPTFTGSSCINSAALVGTDQYQVANGLLAWGTTIHSDREPVNPESTKLTETQFLSASLSYEELKSIRQRCANIIGNGSTFGQCRSCRLGGLGGSKQ